MANKETMAETRVYCDDCAHRNRNIKDVREVMIFCNEEGCFVYPRYHCVLWKKGERWPER